jgi:O-antigen polymerase
MARISLKLTAKSDIMKYRSWLFTSDTKFVHVVVCVFVAWPWLYKNESLGSRFVDSWLISFLCLAVLLLCSHSNNLSKKITLFLLLCGAYLVAHVAGAESSYMLEALITCVGLFAVWLTCSWGAGLAKNKQLVKWVAVGWLAAAFISSVIGFFQYFDVVPQWLAEWVRSDAGVVSGNLWQRNLLCTLTAIGLVALAYLVRTTGSDKTKAANLFGQHRGIIFLLILFLAIGAAASSSRAGALQWVALIAIALIWRKKMPVTSHRVLIYAGAMFFIAMVVLPRVAALFAVEHQAALVRIADTTGSGRVGIWLDMVNLISQKPWFGHGWGGLATAHFNNVETNFHSGTYLDNAHNFFLHFAAELGIPAALFITCVLALAAYRQKPWQETAPERVLMWGFLLMVSIHSFFEFPWMHGSFLMGICICVGFLSSKPVSKGAIENSESSKIMGPNLLWIFIAFASGVLAICLRNELAQTRDRYYSGNFDQNIGVLSPLFERHTNWYRMMHAPITKESALEVWGMANKAFMYAPDPHQLRALIEASATLGNFEVSEKYTQMYKKFYPEDFKNWEYPKRTKSKGLQKY